MKYSCSVKIINMFRKHEKTAVLQKYRLELAGLIEMVEGLEYHYKNFLKKDKKQRQNKIQYLDKGLLYPSDSRIHHDAVAYLNRLGQLEALLTSEWFDSCVIKQSIAYLCPMLLAVIPLRNKFTAHRSIDAPWGETKDQKASHAKLPFYMSRFGSVDKTIDSKNSVEMFKHSCISSNFGYQIHIPRKDRHKKLDNNNIDPVLDIEILSVDTVTITFILSKHHKIICDEILDIVKQVFESPK